MNDARWRDGAVWRSVLGVVLALSLVFISGCPDVGGSGEYGYLIEVKGDVERHFATQKKKGKKTKYPLVFSPESDPDWLLALRKLRAGILYPAADGYRIFIVGDLDAVQGSFVLERWFITTPFFETVLKPGKPKRIRTRRILRPSDFYVDLNIDLRKAVLDARLAGSREWGGVGAPYSKEDFDF